jgi:peptide/nickel transport system permease protein
LAGGVIEHPLGTDQLGRDMLSRIIFAFRPSLGIAAIGTIIGLVLGTVIGLVSGLTEGWRYLIWMTKE